jgi:hypothetical protein
MLAQCLQPGSGIRVATLHGAYQGSFGFGDPTFDREQHRQGERGVRIARVVRVSIRRLGTREITPVFEQYGKVVGGVGVAASTRTSKRGFGFGQLLQPGKEHGELERAVGIAALVGAAIRRRRASEVATLFEQHAEVVCGGGVAALVGACEPFLSFGEPVLRSEQGGLLERALSIVASVGATLRHHLISQMPSPIVLAFARRGAVDPNEAMGRLELDCISIPGSCTVLAKPQIEPIARTPTRRARSPHHTVEPATTTAAPPHERVGAQATT